MSEVESRKCPSCGCTELSFEKKHVKYKGVEIQWVAGWHCPCGNAVLNAEEAFRVQNEYQDSQAFWNAVERISEGG